MNAVEAWFEAWLGYAIDWDATGTWVGGLGTILAVGTAAGIALFQHWSNHDVAMAQERVRLDRLAQLCNLIVVEVTIIETDAKGGEDGEQFNAFDWAFLRADRARLEPFMMALSGIALLDLPSNMAMAYRSDLSRELGKLIAAAEALTAAAREHEDTAQRRNNVAILCETVTMAADGLRGAVTP